jgi:putative transposase
MLASPWAGQALPLRLCHVWLRSPLYCLFFIEHGTRQVYFAGCTAHPDNARVTQQARQMTWEFEDRELPMKYRIRDHDTKFTQSFDTVFEAAGIEIVNIPYQAPNANVFAE